MRRGEAHGARCFFGLRTRRGRGACIVELTAALEQELGATRKQLVLLLALLRQLRPEATPPLANFLNRLLVLPNRLALPLRAALLPGGRYLSHCGGEARLGLRELLALGEAEGLSERASALLCGTQAAIRRPHLRDREHVAACARDGVVDGGKHRLAVFAALGALAGERLREA